MGISKETSATLWWVFFIAIAVAIVIVVLFPMYQTRQAKVDELAKRQEKLNQKSRERDRLSDKVDRLQNDPATVEKEAKEKFGMGTAKDTVIIYEK